jgi:predicted AlkP superfamily pyrophosphatase or phosphodiesterase
MLRILLVAFLLLGLPIERSSFAQASVFPPKPKLVLLVVVDQMRADYLTRFESRFLPSFSSGGRVGGFRYLMANGAYFPFAEHGLLQNMTGPGHATLLTGSFPYQNGIPLNTWYDFSTKKDFYCVADPAATLVPEAEGAGASPNALIGTTVGDELKNAGYASRVISISLKDRAAVLMGGHRADLALWFDPIHFGWFSSRFYLSEGTLPGWVKTLNDDVRSRKGEFFEWNESGTPSGLSLPFSGEFGHKAMIGTKEVLAFPYGVMETVRAAKSAMDAMKLGRGKATDILAVSFSSHDMLGHVYGPNTHEMEEITVVEDRQISELLNHVRTTVPGGLQDVAIVLTADHGIPPSITMIMSNRIQGGRIEASEIVDRIDRQLIAKFGRPEGGDSWIPYQKDFNFYLRLNDPVAARIGEDKVEAIAKTELLKTPGIAHAFSLGDFLHRTLPPGILERQILRSYHPGRSGNLVAIPKPYYTSDDDLITHQTGYSYDRTVPLILAGKRFKKGLYPNGHVEDLAPTLSYILGVLPPSLSEGRVMSEILTK